MRKTTGSIVITLGAMFCCGMLATSPARSGVTITLDAEVLNKLLPALAPREVVVPVAGGHSLTVGLEGLKVTGFDPGAGGAGAGHILTGVTLRVPQMGLVMPVEPRLSVQVATEGAENLLELRFQEVQLRLPLAGSINVAAFLPPLRFPAEGETELDGASQGTRVRSRLVNVVIGKQALRLDLDLDVLPASPR